MYEGICDAIRHEMAELEEKYADGAKMTEKDMNDIDKMAHALKSIVTYEAMTDNYPRKRYRDDGYRRY